MIFYANLKLILQRSVIPEVVRIEKDSCVKTCYQYQVYRSMKVDNKDLEKIK